MGQMLDVYYDCYKILKEKKVLNNGCFYVSDFKHYNKFLKKNKNFISLQNLFEWNLTNLKSSSEIKINEEVIKNYENKYFVDNSIWEVFSSDRRIFYGSKSKYIQDYSSDYNYEHLIKLAINSIIKIEKFIELVKPDYIIGFTTATFGEYLFYLIAKKHNIKFSQLRHTKILNNYTFCNNMSEKYQKIKSDLYSNNLLEYETEINNFIDKYKKSNLVYEGNITFNLNIKDIILNFPKEFTKSIFNTIKYANKYNDNHYKLSFIKIYYYDKIYRFFKFKFQNIYFRNKYFNQNNLSQINYIFFPLHAEPEIALSIFSKYYQNQIEVIRNISLTLPMNYRLIVKEHPRNIGRRSNNYYKKIDNIPNVNLVNPNTNTNNLIMNSKLVIVLSGFIAFEAVLLKKPVIVLGNAIYNMLPRKMINYVDNIKSLKKEIYFSLNKFEYNNNKILSYLNSIFKNSKRIDLYTVLLQKIGRGGGSQYSQKEYIKNINYLSELIQKELSNK